MGFQKLIQSGNVIEYYNYERNINDISALSVRAERIERDQVVKRQDNITRVFSVFRRLIQANLLFNTPFFITFTFREYMTIDEGYRELKKFNQRMRYLFGKSFRYIIVPEYGTKNTRRLHFHALYWDLPNYIKFERSTRLLASMWANGYVDLIETDGNIKLSYYMAKYLRKSQYTSSLFKQKSYVCSRNVFRPVEISSVSKTDLWGNFHKGWSVDSCLDMLISAGGYSLTLKKQFDTIHLGRCNYEIYN